MGKFILLFTFLLTVAVSAAPLKWEEEPSPVMAPVFDYVELPNGTLIAGGQGLYKSTDNGTKWTSSGITISTMGYSSPVENLPVVIEDIELGKNDKLYALMIDPWTSTRVLIWSTDMGNTWEIPVAFFGQDFSKIISLGGVLFLVSGNQVLMEDATGNLNPIDLGQLDEYEYISDFSINSDGNFLFTTVKPQSEYFITHYKIYDDENWYVDSVPYVMDGMIYLTNINFNSDYIFNLYQGPDSLYVYRSADKGQNYELVYQMELINIDYVTDFNISTNGNLIAAIKQNNMANILVSTNNGENWNLAASSIESDFRDYLTIKEDKVILATFNGLYTSVDGVTSWEEKFPNPGNNMIHNIYTDLMGNKVAIEKFYDGDAHLVRVFLYFAGQWMNYTLYDVAEWNSSVESYLMSSSGMSFIYGFDLLLIDQFGNIVTHPFVDRQVYQNYDIQSTIEGDIYLKVTNMETFEAEIWHYNDLTQSFTKIKSIALTEENYYDDYERTHLHVSPDGDVFILDYNDNIYISKDNGSTWTESKFQNRPQWEENVYYLNNTIFLYDGELWKTSDNGATLNVVAIDENMMMLSGLTGTGNKLFASGLTGVFMSTDNGDSWENAGIEAATWSLNIDYNGYLWAPNTITILKTETAVTSVEDGNTEVNTLAYPNPANDVININSETTPEKIEIINLSGVVVKTASYQNFINIKNLPQGSYILKIYNNGSATTENVTIIK